MLKGQELFLLKIFQLKDWKNYILVKKMYFRPKLWLLKYTSF